MTRENSGDENFFCADFHPKAMRNRMAEHYLPMLSEMFENSSLQLSETEFESLSKKCVRALLKSIEDFSPPSEMSLDQTCRLAMKSVIEAENSSASSTPSTAKEYPPEIPKRVVMLIEGEQLSLNETAGILDLEPESVLEAYWQGLETVCFESQLSSILGR